MVPLSDREERRAGTGMPGLADMELVVFQGDEQQDSLCVHISFNRISGDFYFSEKSFRGLLFLLHQQTAAIPYLRPLLKIFPFNLARIL